jgi:hypothetical protein
MSKLIVQKDNQTQALNMQTEIKKKKKSNAENYSKRKESLILSDYNKIALKAKAAGKIRAYVKATYDGTKTTTAEAPTADSSIGLRSRKPSGKTK